MSRSFGWFLAGLIVGAWCAGLAMRWEQLQPVQEWVEEPDGVQPVDPRLWSFVWDEEAR
jgi:hypothetical protein